LPVGRGLELGSSGAYGAQDGQPDDTLRQWHYGFDLRVDVGPFLLEGEWVQGRAPGAAGPVIEGGADVACARAACLKYKAAYASLAWFATAHFTPYVRADYRDAVHRSGDVFVYVTDAARVTGGVRARLGTYVFLKAEYVSNIELGRVPRFANDVLATSLVLSY